VGFRLNRFRFLGNPVTVAYASGDTVYKFTDEPPAAPSAAAALAPSHGLLRSATAVDLDVAVPAGAARLKINIWDRFGRHVHVLAEETSPAPGARKFAWDFRDMNGAPLATGAYIIRITVDGRSESRIAHKTD
jgi:hypothetical protein